MSISKYFPLCFPNLSRLSLVLQQNTRCSFSSTQFMLTGNFIDYLLRPNLVALSQSSSWWTPLVNHRQHVPGYQICCLQTFSTMFPQTRSLVLFLVVKQKYLQPPLGSVHLLWKLQKSPLGLSFQKPQYQCIITINIPAKHASEPGQTQPSHFLKIQRRNRNQGTKGTLP